MLANGFSYLRDPILRPLDTIECRDAILDMSDPDHPREPDWPAADVVIGNPPFLGDKRVFPTFGWFVLLAVVTADVDLSGLQPRALLRHVYLAAPGRCWRRRPGDKA
jgi:hypothetical protein